MTFAEKLRESQQPDPGRAADRRRARLDLRRHRHRDRGRGARRRSARWSSRRAQGSMNWQTFKESLMGGTRLYCMIALILAGAAFLTLSMGYIGLPRHLAEWIATLGLTQVRADPRADRVLRRPRLLPRRHLDGRADHGRDHADGAEGRHRPALVRHLHRARRRDGADHAAGRLQPVRAAGHDQARDRHDRARRLPVLPADGGDGRPALRRSRSSSPSCRSR